MTGAGKQDKSHTALIPFDGSLSEAFLPGLLEEPGGECGFHIGRGGPTGAPRRPRRIGYPWNSKGIHELRTRDERPIAEYTAGGRSTLHADPRKKSQTWFLVNTRGRPGGVPTPAGIDAVPDEAWHVQACTSCSVSVLASTKHVSAPTRGETAPIGGLKKKKKKKTSNKAMVVARANGPS